MRITDLLSASSIDLNAKPLNKKEAIEQAVKLMAASGNITDIEAYTKQVIAREEESTTGVGDGIAIPHGKCSAVSRPGLAAMIIRDGVDYDSLDGEPVNVLFLIAAPDSEDNVHLDVLSKLSVLLMDEEFIRKLKAAKDIGKFLEVIDNADSESMLRFCWKNSFIILIPISVWRISSSALYPSGFIKLLIFISYLVFALQRYKIIINLQAFFRIFSQNDSIFKFFSSIL